MVKGNRCFRLWFKPILYSLKWRTDLNYSAVIVCDILQASRWSPLPNNFKKHNLPLKRILAWNENIVMYFSLKNGEIMQASKHRLPWVYSHINIGHYFLHHCDRDWSILWIEDINFTDDWISHICIPLWQT